MSLSFYILDSKLVLHYIPFQTNDEECYKEIVALFTRRHFIIGTGNNRMHILDEDYKGKINELIDKWKVKCERIGRLREIINKVEIGANFAFIGDLSDVQDVFKYYLAVERIKGRNVTEYNNVIDLYYYRSSYLFDNYDARIYGLVDNENICIGEKNKDKRRCRFCGKIKGETSFRNKAHAIPEALGNKRLFCYEECDSCNSKFSNIEKDFIKLMDFRRSMFEINTKKTSKPPLIKGLNFNIEYGNEKTKLNFVNRLEDCFIDDGEFLHYKLIHQDFVVKQNIYRALAKIVIDLMPSEYLHKVSATISWINGNFNAKQLPKIFEGFIDDGSYWLQPRLLILTRKNQENIPYMAAILQTIDMIYCYVVPFVEDTAFEEVSYNMDKFQEIINRFFDMKFNSVDYSTMSKERPYYKLNIKKDSIDPFTNSQTGEMMKLIRN